MRKKQLIITIVLCLTIYLNGGTKMKTKIIELPAMKFVAVRNIGNYWNLPKAWGKLMPAVHGNKLIHDKAQFMSLFWDHHNDTPESEKVSDASMSIPLDMNYEGDLEVTEIKGGLYAVTVHFGTCEKIGPEWEKWTKEFLSQGEWEIDKTRPSLEWYQNNIEEINPELGVTFMCDPVKKKK